MKRLLTADMLEDTEVEAFRREMGGRDCRADAGAFRLEWPNGMRPTARTIWRAYCVMGIGWAERLLPEGVFNEYERVTARAETKYQRARITALARALRATLDKGK